MAQELSLPLSAGSNSFPEPRLPNSLASLAVPLMGSLLQTYGAVWLFCKQPWPSSLTWPSLFRTAAAFLLVTLLAHLFAVWFNRRIFGAHVDASFRLLAFVIWPSVVWLPLFVLFVRERSPWAALVLPVIAASTFVSLKRWFFPGRSIPAPAGSNPGDESVFTLFHSQPSLPLVRRLAPALATSIALQGAIAEIVLDRPIFAGSLFAACTLLPIWITPRGLQPFRDDLPTSTSARLAAPRTLLVFLCLAVALIPYLRLPILADAMRDLMGAHLSGVPSPAPAQSHAGVRAPGYVGIILTLPPKHQPRVLLSPPLPAPANALLHKPRVIPFDGQYWFFQQPFDRPGPGAPVVRGDPTRRTLASTTAEPITMEAHQLLATPVQLTCCRALHLTLRNAEPSPDPITVEVRLGNTPILYPTGSNLSAAAATASTAGKRPTHGSYSAGKAAPGVPGRAAPGVRSSTATTFSLGAELVPSSPQPPSATHPLTQTLTFPLPATTRGHTMNEITVILKRSPAHARKAPHIAIQSFEFIP